MKVKVTITSRHVATFDAGDIPANLIKDILGANDGTFDGNWGIGDINGSTEEYITDFVEVEEIKS
jgi:hypothetical protein